MPQGFVNPLKQRPYKAIANYRKSSIKPPGAFSFFKHF